MSKKFERALDLLEEILADNIKHNWLRTADYHTNCRCHRCLMDEARLFVEKHRPPAPMGTCERLFVQRFGRRVDQDGTFICTGGEDRCEDCRCGLPSDWRDRDEKELACLPEKN